MDKTTSVMQVMKAQADRLIELMPNTIQEIVGVIGLESTMAIVECYGGLDFHMPKNLGSDNAKRLIEIIGKADTQKLIKHFGGERLYISRCDYLRHEIKKQMIFNHVLSLIETGLSQSRAIQESAILFGVAERRVYKYLKAYTTPSPDLLSFI